MDKFRMICYCISHFYMMMFLLAFTQRKYSLKKTLGILGTAFFLLSGMDFLRLFLGNSEQAYSITIVFQIVVLQGVAILISDFRDFRALFTGLMASNYVLPGVMSSAYLHMLTGWDAASLVYEMVMNAANLWILVYLLRPVYLEVQRQNRDEWMALCLMPVLFYSSAMGLDLAVRGSGKPVHALMAVMFFLLTMYVAYVLVFRMIGKLYREQQAVEERQILEAGIRALRHELDDLSETERRIAVHVHDRRHLVRIMQQMMAEKNYDGMNQILDRMQDMTEVRCPAHYTDNAPVNGVLVSYAAEAEQKHISFLASLELPKTLRVNDWQLAVVIGNLLDNAIRACEKVRGGTEKTIRVTARQVRSQVLVEIRNTCGADVAFDERTGLPVPQRGEEHGEKHGEKHGIGLYSVAYFAQKNQVAFDCGMEQGEFFARMLI